VMLDADGMPPTPGYGSGVSRAFGDLADRLAFPTDLLQLEPVPFIPVVRSSAALDEITRIGLLGEELGAGWALRIQLGAAAPAPVETILEHLAADPADLDLVLDLTYVDKVDQQLVDAVSGALADVRQLGRFRSTSVLSGSIPKALNQTEQWEQPRLEEELWRTLVDGGTTDLRLGDYGVVHPVADNGFRRSHHISLKYSCSDHWLYLRERIVDPGQENSTARTVQLVCSNLVGSGSFSGPTFSWGDHEFATAASGSGHGLGSTSKPIAFATSHHLAYLAALSAA
jgi:hypothetical protein